MKVWRTRSGASTRQAVLESLSYSDTPSSTTRCWVRSSTEEAAAWSSSSMMRLLGSLAAVVVVSVGCLNDFSNTRVYALQFPRVPIRRSPRLRYRNLEHVSTLGEQQEPQLAQQPVRHRITKTVESSWNRASNNNNTETSSTSAPAPKSLPAVSATIPSLTSATSSSSGSSSSSIQVVTNVHQLRHAILDQNLPLKQIQVELPIPNNNNNTNCTNLQNHAVVQLLASRFRNANHSFPNDRGPDDPYRLALCLEGGGMRGAVSAGMAAAIASLGLTNCFDSIYGSSAGSVIGAYMVSRQMCMDVYVDILPAAKRTFVCVKRMMGGLAVTALDWGLSKVSPSSSSSSSLPRKRLGSRITTPGMNISFVLDGIMHDTHGIRPLDLRSFQTNNEQQPLRVASSYVDRVTGQLKTQCFGTEHFSDPSHPDYVRRADGKREGIYACLEASMTVPGATGPPVPLVTKRNNNQTSLFFDAFCFEPLPYRSAVAEGATHALVLCSRPEGFQPKTTPGVYERGIAPIYFRSHGLPQVARFFERGGQQYIYAEDLLTLAEGQQDTSSRGVHVPPPELLYGTTLPRDAATQRLVEHRHHWQRAHLLPVQVPRGTPELPTLEQERSSVADAVRSGFAAAFDLLAPAVGLDELSGAAVAELVFPPDAVLDEFVLDYQLRVTGDDIRTTSSTSSSTSSTIPTRRKRDFVLRFLRQLHPRQLRRQNRPAAAEATRAAAAAAALADDNVEPLCVGPGEHLLTILPGFASGKMAHLAASLRNCTVSA